ncbi:sirohydrochlorin chelatase [Gracilibacillus dipsosauri]|uniref:Sirohydrochlorin chelatase n=1 Tax=Gracilibacillus dipsosauri TaxID=178340 RepID=A0A317L5F7_9BACI|nr:sirohydrochlorin chelatase [Gracilibacillus dipsosauri]PWU69059.1 sirohydrochlorin chelatase [Gracilibacillus dipsosauri]
MKAVIYICHGSRVEESKKEAFQLIDKVKQQVDIPIQETCFLELQEPDLSETVHKIVAKGVTQITIVPILLLTAGHAKHDIPKMIEEERNKYPQIVFRYGRPIEIEPKMITIVEDHIKKTTDETEKFDILFVGRGSSDPQAVNDTETLVEMLREKFPNNLIEKCFLAASSPKFEKVLTEKINKQKKSVLVVPYLLFTGLLIKEIKQFLEKLTLADEQELLMTEYLSQHELLSDILKDRVLEVTEGME